MILFGAGASVDAGVPAMSGFVSGRLKSVARDARMETWLNDLLRDIGVSSGDNGEDRENLEWLWSRLDLACHVGVPCAESRRAEFVRLAARAFMPTDCCKLQQCAYGDLLRRLNSSIEERLTDDSLAFISFNYDTALDWHLLNFGSKKCGWDPNSGEAWTKSLRYWIGRPYEAWQEGTCKLPKLLKLHGSLNWGVCEDLDCGSGVRMLPDFKSLPASLSQTSCEYHGEDKSRKLLPLMVPPSWLKAPNGYNLRRIWGRAQVELRHADALIVIGHSLPDTDVYFKHFLGLAVGRRSQRKPLGYLVVDVCQCSASRYACFLDSLGCTPLSGSSITDGKLIGAFGNAVGTIANTVASVFNCNANG